MKRLGAPAGAIGPRRRSRTVVRRQRLVLLIAGVALTIAIIVALASQGGSDLRAPLPGIGQPPRAGDPFGYIPSRQAEFVARATAGSAHVLFTKSPGGVLATAARVAKFRPLIDAATRGTGIDPELVEGIVFVESAGRPDVIAGSDPADAAGLTQILAQTGQSLLGMHIDLAKSRALLGRIGNATSPAHVRRLLGQLARADERFDPSKAIAATVRYLTIAQQHFGRADLAVVSYHMGIGNLQQVLDDYDSGKVVPYVQLYFDTAPDHHPAAYNLLSGFGDQSSLYYWRVLGAVQIMKLYRSDRAVLSRLANLQNASDSTALVLHPPDRTPTFADPSALAAGYAAHAVMALPSNAAALGLSYNPSMGAAARQLGVPVGLYRGLRPAALDLLVELAARVRALSNSRTSLIVSSTVTDAHYQRVATVTAPESASGYSFEIERRYTREREATAFQAMLDRLQALNVIGWTRTLSTIDITVASDASHVIVDGP